MDLYVGIAIVLSGMGVLCLRRGWRRKESIGRARVAGGWALLVLSWFVWREACGVEFGTVYALAWPALLAWLLIVSGREVRALQADVPGDTGLRPGGGRKWLTFLSAGPLAGVATALLTLVLVLLLPLDIIDQMAIAALLYPLLWGVWAYVGCAFERPALATVVAVLVSAGSAGLLFSGGITP